MLGYIYITVKAMILKQKGEAVWHKILQAAGYQDLNTNWDSKTHYDDKDTYAFFRAVITVLGLSAEDIYERFGVFFFDFTLENGWENMLKCMAYNLHEFLDNLSSMHFFISQIVYQTDSRPPSFKCEAKPDGSLRLHYYSPRQGFFPIVKGIIRQAAKILFKVDVKMFVMEHTQDRRGNSVTEHVVFSVESLDENISLTDNLACAQETTVPKPLSISVAVFCSMFPTHICFNKQLTIEHCGLTRFRHTVYEVKTLIQRNLRIRDFLFNELDLARRRSTKLTDIFTLIQPDDVPLTFKGIQTFSNCLFVFHLKQALRRRASGVGSSNKTGGNAQPRALFALKGQMTVINNGNHLLYMSSPSITTVQDLSDATLYLSDLQLHDATRDLIMLNTTRISQQELNKKLEETFKAMKALADELEKKKAQTEHLLLDCLPPLIAEQMRKNHFVPAQEFPESTCMQCDFPHFGTISIQTSATDVVNLISELFNVYDHLIDLHGCYKVVQLMDSYFIISGVPNKQADHTCRMFNLALGMMMEAKQLIVPKLNLPVLLRISIHSGSVITCIVGTSKIRYVVMGETVNVSKKLIQHIVPGKIIVTNAAKLSAEKNKGENDFEYTNRGYLNIGNNQATCTFYLERNLKKTVWELIDKPRGPKNTTEGYKEIHSVDDLQAWDVYEKNLKKQHQIQQKTTNIISDGSKHNGVSSANDKIHKIKQMLKARSIEQTPNGIVKTESSACSIQ